VFARPSNPVPGHNPIPAVGAEAPGVHPLTSTQLHSPAPLAQTVIIPGPDQPYDYAIGTSGINGKTGCEVLRVTLNDFEPGLWGGTFATIEEVGEGEDCGHGLVMTVPYEAGIHSGRAGKYEIRFEVEADTLGKVTRVRRARLSWR
jgi:hypothetical protein